MASPAQPTPRYSKEDLLAKLKEGGWNTWWNTLDAEGRSAIGLSKEDLRSFDLKDIKLSGAHLSGCDFTEAIVSGADLSNVNLASSIFNDAFITETNLSGAHLANAQLHRVYLRDVNLAGASVLHADFRDARLQGADFTNVKDGIIPRHLAGADLTGAKLPEPISKLYEKLEAVSQISDSAKKLFLALLAACLYSWLTIGTTKDVDLITNRASSPLPVIQTAIPIVGFYVIAPIILLCVYFYFHFYLQKLWEELAQLPAIFPDGKPLHQRADPWLFNDLVRAHFTKLKNDRPFLSYFQQFTSVLLAWGLVPITLLIFWIRYLPRHGKYGTYFHAIAFTLCALAAVRLYLLARGTLRGHPRLTLKQIWKRPSPYITAAAALLTLVGVVKLSQAIIYGTPQAAAVRLMEWFGYSPFANLIDADISIKPPNWTGKEEEEIDQVKGANLTGKNLRYANAQGAFLTKANLRGSNLTEADLSDSELTGADLSSGKSAMQIVWENRWWGRNGGNQLNQIDVKTNLSHTYLFGAHLRGANFARTTLIGAWLTDADLTSANLIGSDLSGAHLDRTNFTGANLSNANLTDTALSLTPDPSDPNGPDSTQGLKYADLSYASGLTPYGLQTYVDWSMAFYDPKMLEQLGLPPDHNEALRAYRDSKSQQPFDDAWQQKWRASKAKTDSKLK